MAIADLQERGWHGLIRQGKHAGTSNVGIIHAGEATNVITPELKLRAEARSHDPVFRKRIVSEFRKAFERAAKAVRSADGKTAKIDFSADLHYEAFRLPLDAAPVKIAKTAIAALGMKPQIRIANGGLDANWMTAHGLPTVTLGCGQHEIHTVNEWLDIPSYLAGCRLGLLLATGAAE
jgi:tripeptide aminopeptidase